jgi:hypothetical protein
MDVLFCYYIPLVVGDNHCGYVGFRNAPNDEMLDHDGAMDMVVVDDW